MQRIARWISSSLSPSPVPQPLEGREREEAVAMPARDTEATMSNSTSAAERPHNLPEPEDKPSPNEIAIQRNAALLAELGIKTRDFMYESTLPPIKSVPHIPVQTVRPRTNPLKRKRDEDEGPGEEYEGQTLYFEAERRGTTIGMRPRKKQKQVERTPTEPADIIEDPPAGASSQPVRTYGYADLSSLVRQPRPAFPNSQQPYTPPRFASPTLSVSPGAGPSHTGAEASPSQFDSKGTSQETDGWIATPLATPRSSRHAPVDISSAIPASQLDTPSRLPPPEDVTYAQLGFTPDSSPRLANSNGSPSSPIRPLTYSPTSGTPSGLSPSPASPSPVRRHHAPAVATTRRASSRRTPQDDVPEPVPTVRTSRYNLRERVAPGRVIAAVKSRAVRAISSRQEAASKCPSPAKKGKAAQSSSSKRGAKSSPPKRKTKPSSPKRNAKPSPPKRTTKRTAKQALLG